MTAALNLFRKWARGLLRLVVRVFGTRIIDERTGEPAGHALFIGWRGRLHVIGLESALGVHFRPQTRLTYWRQEVVFSSHPPPDFPDEASPRRSDDPPPA